MTVTSSSAIPGFLPSTNGLHFRNQFEAGPTVRLGPLDPRWIGGMGDAKNGLCGGMAWYVRERFEAGQSIPPDRVAPANGSPLFQALVRRQVQSLEWGRVPIGFWRIGAFGPDGTARRTREHELPRIRATIDRGRLAMVGLVRHQGINPFHMTTSHQVLGYGYTVDGDTTTLRIYDSNHPDVDTVVVVAGPASILQSTGETLYGVLSLD
jgi:hypothetical protein